MQILIISANSVAHKQYNLSVKHMVLAAMLLLLVFAIAVLWTSQRVLPIITDHAYHALVDNGVVTKHTLFDHIVKPAEDELPAFYAKKLGQLQAEAIRLKAIVEQLADLADFDLTHYSLDSLPAQGGIEQPGLAMSIGNFETGLSTLNQLFAAQSKQLESLQSYLITEAAIKAAIPARKPINEGWLSSGYGYRIDPFNGKRAFHHGVDFAGREGSSIVAVAAGLVSWTGSDGGYGKIVEIDHGNGYITRYAHNKKLLVAVGDKVTKGQDIALMGSTGRSTGPHVHFELLQDGKAINPWRFFN